MPPYPVCGCDFLILLNYDSSAIVDVDAACGMVDTYALQVVVGAVVGHPADGGDARGSWGSRMVELAGNDKVAEAHRLVGGQFVDVQHDTKGTRGG